MAMNSFQTLLILSEYSTAYYVSVFCLMPFDSSQGCLLIDHALNDFLIAKEIGHFSNLQMHGLNQELPRCLICSYPYFLILGFRDGTCSPDPCFSAFYLSYSNYHS